MCSMPRARIDTSRARRPLDAFNSTQHVIDAISAANNIIVVSGAGISVSCGIPDFRSQNGIYNTLRCEELNLPSPELLFDSEFFSIDPAPFYKFIRNAFPDNPQPSATHHFIRLLEKKKKLLRNYTQNIDGLESAVNINRVVECHGSFSSFRCLTCRSVRDKESCWQDVVNGQVPHCSACNKGFMVLTYTLHCLLLVFFRNLASLSLVMSLLHVNYGTWTMTLRPAICL